MMTQWDRPIVVQSDLTIWLDSGHPEFAQVQEQLGAFAELIKSPDQGMHTYKITPLTLWSAASDGISAEDVLAVLERYDRIGVAASVKEYIAEMIGRYGKLRLVRVGDVLVLTADEWKQMREICDIPQVKAYFRERKDALQVAIDPAHRGMVKQELLKAGYPVIDLAGYHSGESLPIRMRGEEEGFTARDYQIAAADRYYRGGSAYGGSGVVVLPCGAGKTIVGLLVMAKLQCATLILTSSMTSVAQWKSEIMRRTNLDDEWVGEYSANRKQVRPVTIATYQMLTWRKEKDGTPVHMDLFHERDWGFIIYDEVHLLPAPVFRITAGIQALRRLGLTATLVREDGREDDVFSLIGPKRFEMRWKSLEQQGWIAEAVCQECSVPLPPAYMRQYLLAPKKSRHRLAALNPNKWHMVQILMDRHANSKMLVIGQYLEQLRDAAAMLEAPIITGKTSQAERKRLYDAFNCGDIRVLVVSKVANFAVDLPEASVAIQLSGSYGSRQEEAQRLGRLLRPKQAGENAWFYTLVSSDSCEEEYARNRELFLIEQGYVYKREHCAI